MRIFNTIALILSRNLFIDKYNCTSRNEPNENDIQVNEAAQPSAAEPRVGPKIHSHSASAAAHTARCCWKRRTIHSWHLTLEREVIMFRFF